MCCTSLYHSHAYPHYNKLSIVDKFSSFTAFGQLLFPYYIPLYPRHEKEVIPYRPSTSDLLLPAQSIHVIANFMTSFILTPRRIPLYTQLTGFLIQSLVLLYLMYF